MKALISKVVEEGAVFEAAKNKYIFGMARVLVRLSSILPHTWSAEVIESDGFVQGPVNHVTMGGPGNSDLFSVTLMIPEATRAIIDGGSDYGFSIEWEAVMRKTNGEEMSSGLTVFMSQRNRMIDIMVLRSDHDFQIDLIGAKFF